MNYTQKTINIDSVESDVTAAIENYFQQVIKLVNDQTEVILYFNIGNTYHPDFIPGLFTSLIAYQDGSWFMNSRITIDSDKEIFKNEIMDLVIDRLQSATSDVEEEIINADNWFKLPVMTDHLATQEDVDAGDAIFNINPESGLASLMDVYLPHCALYHDENGQDHTCHNCVQKNVIRNVTSGCITNGKRVVALAKDVQLLTPEELFGKH